MPDDRGWKTGADPGQSVEGRIGGWLDRVPGYRGYRSKEDRRDADRLVRERVAADLTALAGRVETVARELANKRRLSEIGPVDDLARTMRHLIDRVRTASYGYGGLFSNRDIDEAALDQLRLFDESLLAGVSALDGPVSTLEAALGSDGDPASATEAAKQHVGRLHVRLDLRGRVIEGGEPAPAATVQQVLQPIGPPPVSPAFSIGYRDAVAILGDNFVVDARIDVSADGRAFRLFRLSADEPERWLYVPKDPAESYAQLTKSGAPAPAPGTATIEGVAYSEVASGSGDAELSTGERASGRRPVAYRIFQGSDAPARRAIVLDWQGEQHLYTGTEVHTGDVEVYGATTR